MQSKNKSLSRLTLALPTEINRVRTETPPGVKDGKDNQQGRIMMAAINDREYDWYKEHGIKMKSQLVEGKMTRGLWMDEDHEAMKKKTMGEEISSAQEEIWE
ncbi:hypothetical protein DFP73DRAFT_599780 [Morchella snyderi]|nr:hypothetical protein DFP73DRAFT_599780 [Morchella snyderi]